MRHPLIFGAVLLGALVAMSGCATRGSVKVLQGEVKEHARRMDAESGRIDAVGQHLEAVGQRVDALDSRVGTLANHHHSASVVSTMDLRFAFGSAELNDAGMTQLHALAKDLRDDPRTGLEIVGFTDPNGPRDYNVDLSQRRVDAVRRYLVQRGVSVSRIASVGLGPLADRGVPDAQKRRVTVNVTLTETALGPAAPPRTADGSASLNTQSLQSN